MKRYLMLMILTMMLISMKVKATEYSGFLPGGKNYLDEQNMIITTNSMITNDPFLVKPDTFYTLTLPGTSHLSEDIGLQIVGDITYFDDDILLLNDCVVELQDVHCTFKTTASESFLSIVLNSPEIIGYYNYYGFDNFQLEEGTSSTVYEAYIAPQIDLIEPLFSGSGAYIKSYRDQMSLAEIIQEHINVVDEIDGNLNDQIVIVSDEYTGNGNLLGEYVVLLTACDDSQNCASFNLTIIVKDEISPVITGPISIDVDASIPVNIIDLIHANFSYTDEYDPTCTLRIIRDDYTPNNQILGIYQVEFEIMDDSLNKTVKTFVVNVKDIGTPTIEGLFTYSSPLSNPLTVNQIISNLMITDNIDAYEKLSILVSNDTFSLNKLSIGAYSFTITVNDLSGNTKSQLIQVSVVDDIFPNISGPGTYSYSYQDELTIEQLLGMLAVSDNYSNLSASNIYIISDNFSNRVSLVGEYDVTFGVKDGANNESTHTVHITIFDDVAPVIYVDNFIVTVNLSSTFKLEDALKLLINSNELASGNYLTTTVIDEYKGNEKTPGSYLQKLVFTNELGEEFEKEFIVQVVGEEHMKWDKELMIRNLMVYSVVIGISVFIIIKKKK